MHYWFGWEHMIWMRWLLGIGLLAVLAWAMVQAATGRSRETEPEAILRRRYAAGEIDTDEYKRQLKVLKRKNVA
jgi:uncharacterized membrane protein